MTPLTKWLAYAALLAAPIAAQVTTDCNPMNATCPNDPALGTSYMWNFTSEPDIAYWRQKVSGVTFDPELGATFTVAKQGDSPTLTSNFYFFWGRTEMMMRCANGTGIISSMMWLSDDLDEVDFEFMGVTPNEAATNYFGKGYEDFNNGGYHNLTFNNQDDFHNYTVDWTEDYLKWYIDGSLIRTLVPSDANNSYYFPQTPMTFNIGIWAGGDPSLPQGTIDWAGGETDYDAGPYSMYVKSVKVTDYSNNSAEYEFTDKTGMASSVKIINGTSDVVAELTKTPSKSLSEKFASLSTGAKAGIVGGAGAVALGAIAAALFYFIKQRKRGFAEAAAAEKAAEEAARENADMTARGINPDAFAGKTGADYNALDNASDTGYYGQGSMPNTPVNATGPLDNFGQPTMSGLGPNGLAISTSAAPAAGAAAAGASPNPFNESSLYQNGGLAGPTAGNFDANGNLMSPAGATGGNNYAALNGNDIPLQNRNGPGFAR